MIRRVRPRFPAALARLLLAALLLALPPAAALGAEGSISLGEYQEMLREGILRLEEAEAHHRAGEDALARGAALAARERLSGRWVVESPHGLVRADLTSLEEAVTRAAEQPGQYLGPALRQAREHLGAAEVLAEARPADVPGARESLERALRRMEAKSFIQRVREWFLGLLGHPVGKVVETGAQLPREVYFAAGGLAAGAVLWLLFSLIRSLSAQTAGGEVSLRAGRKGPPPRPPSPQELLARARALGTGGEPLEGLRTAHLALLLHLDALGLLRYRPAETNRELERQLRRRHPRLAERLRSLNDLVDNRLYSGRGATKEDLDAALHWVDELWREGEAVSRSAEATPGRSSSASSS